MAGALSKEQPALTFEAKLLHFKKRGDTCVTLLARSISCTLLTSAGPS